MPGPLKNGETWQPEINRNNIPDRLFFAYADTVAPLIFPRRYKGHGWDTKPISTGYPQTKKELNELSLHIRLKQNGENFATGKLWNCEA